MAPNDFPITGGSAEADWYSDPSARFELRFWDGSKWTDRVISGGMRTVDSLPGMGRPWSTPLQQRQNARVNVGIILLTLWMPLIGIILGTVYMRGADWDKRKPGKVYLWLGLAVLGVEFGFVLIAGMLVSASSGQ